MENKHFGAKVPSGTNYVRSTSIPRPSPRKQPLFPSSPQQFPMVSGRWLLKAFAVSILVAILCAYAALCVLFYQAQWQLVLHPDHNTSTPSTIAGSPFQVIHFAPGDSGLPQLAGWWIPAAQGATYPHITVLYLHGGDHSLPHSAPQLALLHNAGLSLFAIDYRGYGQSAATHPTQQRMAFDAEAALQYLTATRHLDPHRVVLFGTGVGASLATQLAAAHPEIPALILQSPEADLLAKVSHDPLASLLPIRLLFNEPFPLTTLLSALRTPKLLLTESSSAPPSSFVTAADPKTTVEFVKPDPALYNRALSRFLDQYLPPTRVPTLLPERTPPQ